MKDLKLYFGIGCLFILLYLLSQYNKPKPLNWAETYKRNDKIPFGAWVLFHRLPDLFDQGQVTTATGRFYKTIQKKGAGSGSFISITPSCEFDKTDFTAAVDYMKRGNDIFIASYDFGKVLNDTLHLDVVRQDYEENHVTFTDQPQGTTGYRFDKGIGGFWFNKRDTLRSTVLGMTGSRRANFIRYSFGKGSLYLLADPKLFSNYAILRGNGGEYAATALSHLDRGGTVYWDSYSNHDIDPGDRAPLRFIFRNPPLRKAYLVALFAMLLYVVIEMKRRQRVIPETDPLTNSTAEFVTVVGQVYYQQRNNTNIARKNVTYLLEYIRSRYRVMVPHTDHQFEDLLANRSGADRELVARLRELIAAILAEKPVSDKDLLNMNSLMEEFYRLS